MLKIKHYGSFKKTNHFLEKSNNLALKNIIEKNAGLGVQALASSTPFLSGETSNSWHYEVELRAHSFTISWINDNVVDGIPVVILLQYGHGNGRGGYTRGRDFINPAIKPIFDKIADEIELEINKS